MLAHPPSTPPLHKRNQQPWCHPACYPVIQARPTASPLHAHVLPQFEKAENKPVVIGWAAAAVFAFFTAEWLIHLPALDVVSTQWAPSPSAQHRETVPAAFPLPAPLSNSVYQHLASSCHGDMQGLMAAVCFSALEQHADTASRQHPSLSSLSCLPLTPCPPSSLPSDPGLPRPAGWPAGAALPGCALAGGRGQRRQGH